jgi:1-deoxy-D-xylulose-5-phosphate synthase
MHELARRGAFDKGLILRTLCLPDRYIDQADPADMYADAGLSATDIARTIRAAIAGRAEVVPLRQIR